MFSRIVLPTVMIFPIFKGFKLFASGGTEFTFIDVIEGDIFAESHVTDWLQTLDVEGVVHIALFSLL